MPFNGSGTASPPNPPTFPAVSGQTIEAAKFNAIINDLYACLTQCVTKDGQTVITGEFQWADAVTNLAALGGVSSSAAQTIDGLKTFSVAPRSAVAATDPTDLVRKGDLEALLLLLWPPGSIGMFAFGTPPAGWLELDGSVKLRADYPALFASIGTAYNTGGETSLQFRLPQSRGEFARGWDNGRGVDPGRVFGTSQLDALQNLTGGMGGSLQFRNGVGTPSGVFGFPAAGPNGGDNSGGDPTRFIDFDASRVARTASETRPRNFTVMFCIKT